MRLLHTEASGGLGGQELRILREAEGMRARGHEVVMAVRSDGGLVHKAREAGFTVYELSFERRRAFSDLWQLLTIIRRHDIEVVNTHSSWDAWIGAVAARLARCRVLRTRHLSTPIRAGLNSRILYRLLADQVVTTCEATAETVQRQAGLEPERCRSIPTGVHDLAEYSQENIIAFRKRYGIASDHLVIGTVCVLRSWKGVQHLLQAAKELSDYPQLRWLIVGDGPARDYLQREHAELGLDERVIFTGHLDHPQLAMAAMDIFALLSFANEGVSQAALQAAYQGKPLVTTTTGGLREVCIDHETGLLVPASSPDAVAEAIKALVDDADLRTRLGAQAKQRVRDFFTIDHTLNAMEEVYALLVNS